MRNSIDTIKWKLQIGIMMLIAIITICFQISSTPWSAEIKLLSGIFTIVALIFLYILVIFLIEITIIKEDLIELKKRLDKK